MITKDEIIRMAREAGFLEGYPPSALHLGTYIGPCDHLLARFADLVAANEREKCAKLCDEIAKDDNPNGHDECDGAMACAEKIRNS